MSIFEYNEETELKKIREDEYELGREDGLEEGRKLGREDGLEEGKNLGLEEGKEIGARALLKICSDMKISKEAAIRRAAEELAIPVDKAEELADKVWQSLEDEHGAI